MGIKLKYKSLLAYSEVNSKYFYTEFGDAVSIVYGRNTSGKSTLFLAILYTFGINDGNNYLRDVLDEKVLFRLDCTLIGESVSTDLILIRDDETVYLRYGNRPLKKFNGISGNGSVEHVRLKEFLNEIFEFSLMLESKNEFKVAPLETMFLPYYVSQSVGWIYLRKSFSGLEFFKNFKEDYLDYYLGIEPALDRVKRHELQAQLKAKQEEIDTLTSFSRKDEDLQLTRIADEEFLSTSADYVGKYSQKYNKVTELENDYVLKSNELGFLEERRSLLHKVRSGLKLQEPENGNCPACYQTLPLGISEQYSYLQELNDTELQLVAVKDRIKATTSLVNSLRNRIGTEREAIAADYETLQRYTSTGMTFERWMKNKANVELISILDKKLGELTTEKSDIEDKLKQYKTDEDIEHARETFSQAFRIIFVRFMTELNVKRLTENRYLLLYDISAFPSQGVELHKTILAYHFAFVHLVARSPRIHKFPFMLDAIFKEDIEEVNKELIIKFIATNILPACQTIISIAYSSDQTKSAVTYNKEFFANEANMIVIGDGDKERAFLKPHTDEHKDFIQQTIDIMTGIIG